MGLLVLHDKDLPPGWIAVALPVLCLGLGVTYILWIAVYNVFFHPLRAYPGPKLWAMTRLPYTRMFLSGDAHRRVLDLHRAYGPVVRVAPDTLSYSHPDAIKEIRGHRRAGRAEHGKDPVHMGHFRDNILGAGRADHARFRRALAHGFSAQAMADQQPLIQGYVDAMVRRLREECDGGDRELDMVQWFNYTTFDVIGDLAFGEPFGCLGDSVYHPWVALIFDSIKHLTWLSALGRYPAVAPLLKRFLVPEGLAAKLVEHEQLSAEKVRKRLAMGTDRPDFVQAMTTKRDSSKGEALTFKELASHASVLIVAGSETTATALSAATYYLGMNPRALAALTDEVRTTFSSEEEINLLSVQGLSYMLAVLDETLRMHPPVPSGQPRLIAEGGDVILGRYVPAGTKAEVWQWSLYHDPACWTRPDDFIPERWLGDPAFANDKKEALQAFSVGPRNCIGKNLAYAEMRLILARLVWNFDIKLADETRGWDNRCKVYRLWEKGPVNVYLQPRTIS